jgi:hypothetical protein
MAVWDWFEEPELGSEYLVLCVVRSRICLVGFCGGERFNLEKCNK